MSSPRKIRPRKIRPRKIRGPRKIQERGLLKRDFVDSVPEPSGHSLQNIIVLIPGIRTNAEWIDEVNRHLETFSGPIEGRKAFSGRISSFHLVTRWGLNRIKQEIKDQLLKTKADFPEAEISIICHSMATSLIADIVSDLHFSPKYIFFMGSVCRNSHAKKISKYCTRLINHRGTHDQWPIIASFINPYHYGASGTFGFGTDAYVKDFSFPNDHETCTQTQHITNFVIPIINGINPLYPIKVDQKFSYNFYHYNRILFYIFILIGVAALFLNPYLSAFFIPAALMILLFYSFV